METSSEEWIPIEIPDVTLSQEDMEASWVTIPAGSFLYGSPESQYCRWMEDEQVEVVITRPYRIAATEITRAEWQMVGFPERSKPPVCDNCAEGFINWFDALAWLNALSRAVGLPECYDLTNCVGDPAYACPDGEFYQLACKITEGTTNLLPQLFYCEGEVRNYPDRVDCPGYRLPTLAEWEWAARGGTTTATYNGDLVVETIDGCQPDPVVDPLAWHYCNSDMAVHSVGELMPNPYGLYDMLGNVAEWVDAMHTGRGLEADEGKAPPLIDPVGSRNNDNNDRGKRGGSVISSSCQCTSNTNSEQSPDYRVFSTGLRPVRTLFD